MIICEATEAINSNDTDDFSGFHIESTLGIQAGTSFDSSETGIMFICVKTEADKWIPPRFPFFIPSDLPQKYLHLHIKIMESSLMQNHNM